MVASNDLNISESGIVTFDGTSTFAGRTLTAGTGISIANGSGVAGNPTISASGTVGQTITGNSGGALSPTAGNWNIVTANSTVKFVGSGSTFTQDFGKTNLFLGNSGAAITSGTENTAYGIGAGAAITGGSRNIIIGRYAGLNLTGSFSNVAVGSEALSTFTNGAGNSGSNIAIGPSSLNLLSTGILNIGIGATAGSSYTTSESSNIVIGNSGTAAESNKIRIGTSGSSDGQQNQAFIAGITGVTAAGAPAAISSTGQLSDLGFGTSTQILTSNGAGVSPTWQANAGVTTCIFSAYNSSTDSNVTGDGTLYTVIFDTELVDSASAYNNATGIFTAPTTGNYMFSTSLRIDGLLSGHTEGGGFFTGSARDNRFYVGNLGAFAASGVIDFSGSFIIPMTAGDTMSVQFYAANATKVVDVVGNASPNIWTIFSGYLIT